jgi:hypothetical protein
MTPLLNSLKQVNKPDDLELHIDTLMRQKSIIENIKQHTCHRYDFGDMVETQNLLVEEIEKCREQLRQFKGQSLLLVFDGGKEFEEEEEEVSSLSRKYNIEHVIEDEDGRLRLLESGDLDMEKHKGVYKAFKVIYEMEKDYNLRNEFEEDEEEDDDDEHASSKFEIEDLENFNDLIGVD